MFGHKSDPAAVELRDFIRLTLLDIASGLREANEAYKVSQPSSENAFFLTPGRDDKEGTGVHFDVAVTSSMRTGGNAGIKVWNAGLGGERQRARENVSRIRFTVTIRHYVG